MLKSKKAQANLDKIAKNDRRQRSMAEQKRAENRKAALVSLASATMAANLKPAS